MGNRESVCSISDTDYLESSTDSTYISGYMQCQPQQQQQQQLHQRAASKPTTPVPSLRASFASHEPPPSLASADLCSVLNHHHDSVFEPAAKACVCRRSLSTGAGGYSERPRILPIVRNGRQLSEDIYWVLPQRKKHQQQQQTRLSSSSSSDHSCCEPLSFFGPGCSPHDLVHRVTGAVFGVTEEESYLSLSLHHWDTDKAVRYLKVEQLFRCGVGDRDRCVKLLELHNWRLESVLQQLNRKRLCRSDSN